MLYLRGNEIFIRTKTKNYLYTIAGNLCKNNAKKKKDIPVEQDVLEQHSDRLQMVKLYPEGNAETRFKINGVKRFLFYCNRDGLFFVNL